MKMLNILIRKYLLVIAMFIGFAALGFAQGGDVVCTGQTKKYKVGGYPDSEFSWKVEGGVISYQSTLGDTIKVVWGTTPGTFMLKVVEKNFGCHSDTINLPVSVLQIPSLNLDPLVLLCTGKTVELDPGGGFDSYQWSTGETTQTITVSEANEYSVIASSACGLAHDTAVVNLIPLPIANAGNDAYIAAGESATLLAELFPNYTYTWDPVEWLSNPGTYTTVATPNATTVFNLTVTDQFGCENTDFVTVFVDNDMLTIYNAFTPNGDGFNDTWVIRNIELFPDAEIKVYNRSSNLVFESDGYDNSWNGTHYKTGRKLPFGIYYYVIRIPSADKTFRGSVSILR